jgi:glycosyltransferase involved in cell wall biosynthesis
MSQPEFKTVIVAAGRFDQRMAEKIAEGREPRLDVFELARALGPATRTLDFADVDRSRRPDVRAVRRALGLSAAVAHLAVVENPDADAFFTTGEDIGLPLAMLLKLRRSRASHTMIAHTLAPLKKRILFRLGLGDRLDRVLCYASTEERLMVDQLHLPRSAVQRINYHADEAFFRPMPVAEEPDLICSAGQLLRDYDTLVRATTELPVKVRIAAGSPWISKELHPSGGLPPNVDWRRYDRFELRELYARSALAVVPILENDFQTGISTILEMMAMGKCLIVTRTRGQTDTIVDGVTGTYVPPGDPQALRAAITRLLANPEERARMGRAARAFIEKEAGLDLFTARMTQAVRDGHAARRAAHA